MTIKLKFIKCSIIIWHTRTHAGDTVVATLTYGLGSEREIAVDPREVQGLLKNVTALENDRQQQKRTLQECNEKLANYIERVRQLILILIILIIYNYILILYLSRL